MDNPDAPFSTENTYLTPEQEQQYLANFAEFEKYSDFSTLFQHMDDVLGNRGNDYAHPLDNFQRIASGLNWKFGDRFLPGKEFTIEDIPDIFEITKLARGKHRLKLDNPVDIIGYAACQIVLVAERIRRIRANQGK